MEIEVNGHIPVTADCGHQFDVRLGRMEDEFQCPDCGRVGRFAPEEIESIKEQVRDAAVEYCIEQIAERYSAELVGKKRSVH